MHQLQLAEDEYHIRVFGLTTITYQSREGWTNIFHVYVYVYVYVYDLSIKYIQFGHVKVLFSRLLTILKIYVPIPFQKPAFSMSGMHLHSSPWRR